MACWEGCGRSEAAPRCQGSEGRQAGTAAGGDAMARCCCCCVVGSDVFVGCILHQASFELQGDFSVFEGVALSTEMKNSRILMTGPHRLTKRKIRAEKSSPAGVTIIFEKISPFILNCIKDLIVGVTYSRYARQVTHDRARAFASGSGCQAAPFFCCFDENVSFTNSAVVATATKPVELLMVPGESEKKPPVFQD